MKTVLVVIDDKEISNLIRDLLTGLNMQVKIEWSFFPAKQKMYDFDYDILIIDEDVLDQGKPLAIQQLRNTSRAEIYVLVDSIPSNRSNNIKYIVKPEVSHQLKLFFA
jgi:DNA-binding response OmpR family regulator